MNSSKFFLLLFFLLGFTCASMSQVVAYMDKRKGKIHMEIEFLLPLRSGEVINEVYQVLGDSYRLKERDTLESLMRTDEMIQRHYAVFYSCDSLVNVVRNGSLDAATEIEIMLYAKKNLKPDQWRAFSFKERRPKMIQLHKLCYDSYMEHNKSWLNHQKSRIDALINETPQSQDPEAEED